MKLRTRGVFAALPLVLALSLTACGGDEGNGGVASAGGEKTSGAKASTSANTRDMALKFAECMRKNGVPMEDPQDGRITLKNDGSVSQETMQKAQEACRQYSPGGNQNPEQRKAAEERTRQHAACMRQNGVEKFPDPEPGSGGGIKITSEIAEDPDFEAAQKKCQDVLGPGPGQGPKTGAGQ